MFLATTSDQQFWNKHEKILLLGEWCKIYSQKDIWSKLDYQVLPYHWDDRDKRHSDWLYLQSLHEKYLSELAGRLNKIHGANYSDRYWRILIGPWLFFFIPEPLSTTRAGLFEIERMVTLFRKIVMFNEFLYSPSSTNISIKLPLLSLFAI